MKKARMHIWRKVIIDMLREIPGKLFHNFIVPFSIAMIFLSIPYALGYFISKIFVSGTIEGTFLATFLKKDTGINEVIGIITIICLIVIGAIVALVISLKERYELESWKNK